MICIFIQLFYSVLPVFRHSSHKQSYDEFLRSTCTKLPIWYQDLLNNEHGDHLFFPSFHSPWQYFIPCRVIWKYCWSFIQKLSFLSHKTSFSHWKQCKSATKMLWWFLENEISAPYFLSHLSIVLCHMLLHAKFFFQITVGIFE